MNNPKVTFSINQEFDTWKISEFFKLKSQTIYHHLPEIKKLKSKKEIEKYIDTIYQNQLPSMHKIANKMQNKWNKVSNDFFASTHKIFNTKWPKGEYKAYLTICPPYPRLLETKIFQVENYVDKNDSWLLTTHHELLHFIFYDFIRLNYTPELDNTYENKMNKLLKNKFILPIWDISEIHAAILSKSKPYPQHESQFVKLEALWNKTKNIKKFMNELEK